MGNNIFLTGDLHVGKTTLINQLISKLPVHEIRGFRTSRYYQDKKLAGFYIEDICSPPVVKEYKFIGRCVNNNHWVSIPATFDDYGVKILEGCLRDNPKLIVMDELGFFEDDATLFQEKVLQILDSYIPVLGVLKRKETDFLNLIRSRKDVLLFEITPENRNIMSGVIFDELLKITSFESGNHHLDAESYEETARKVFAPVYSLIAEQIKEKTNITAGLCLDVGAGTGHLGIALAKITELNVCLLDCSREMLAIAGKNIVAAGLQDRVHTLWGNVYNLPQQDGTVDLVISRGSLYFWADKKCALKEIFRVLSPGGMAYVGGGFGSPELKRKIDAQMQARDGCWEKNMNKRVRATENLDYKQLLADLDGLNLEIINDEANMWLLMRKNINYQAGTACAE
ncbi:MAG: nucleoside-triphosphatase [Bacillota bacterium]|nr:nucleoside-triphosphatase [Bacillota bacterium]